MLLGALFAVSTVTHASTTTTQPVRYETPDAAADDATPDLDIQSPPPVQDVQPPPTMNPESTIQPNQDSNNSANAPYPANPNAGVKPPDVSSPPTQGS